MRVECGYSSSSSFLLRELKGFCHSIDWNDRLVFYSYNGGKYMFPYKRGTPNHHDLNLIRPMCFLEIWYRNSFYILFYCIEYKVNTPVCIDWVKFCRRDNSMFGVSFLFRYLLTKDNGWVGLLFYCLLIFILSQKSPLKVIFRDRFQNNVIKNVQSDQCVVEKESSGQKKNITARQNSFYQF